MSGTFGVLSKLADEAFAEDVPASPISPASADLAAALGILCERCARIPACGGVMAFMAYQYHFEVCLKYVVLELQYRNLGNPNMVNIDHDQPFQGS